VYDKNSLFSTRTLILRSRDRKNLEKNKERAMKDSKGMVKNLATQIGQVYNQGVQLQQKIDTHLQNIDTQIGQICTSLSNLESQLSGKLPSQPHPNPKEQVNRVILREPEEANELEELEVISEDSNTKHKSTILLGRPFLKTSKALIDVAKGSVVLKVIEKR
ncbi:Cytochrome P450 monooxygenase roqO, partial [Bienertia sinuspersici]